MENKNKPAYPAESTFVNGREFLEHSLPNGRQYPGLTKLELFAMVAMQGLIGEQFKDDAHELAHAEDLARKSIRCAKELLKQLDNEKA